MHRLPSPPDPNENLTNDPRPWLEEKVYARLRQRTVDLVKCSVDALRKDKQRVSLSTVAAKSRELDMEGNGKGISESAILDNQEVLRATSELARPVKKAGETADHSRISATLDGQAWPR
jgi:hypothetical protein